MKDTETKKAARAGFTLVELVVVIVILGVLAGVAYPAYTGYIRKANDAKVQVELNEILLAVESACADNGIDINGDLVNKKNEHGPNGFYVGTINGNIKLKCFVTAFTTDQKEGNFTVNGSVVTNKQVKQSMLLYGDDLFEDYHVQTDKDGKNTHVGRTIAALNSDVSILQPKDLENTSYKDVQWFAWSHVTGWFTDKEPPDLTGTAYTKWDDGNPYFLKDTSPLPSAPAA